MPAREMCVCVFPKETESESGSEQSARCVFVLSAVNVFQIVPLMVIFRRELY